MAKKTSKAKGVGGGKKQHADSGGAGRQSKPKKGSGKGRHGARRKELRQEMKESQRKRQKRAHGKEVEETRQRLRLKLLERQLSRGPGASPGELRRQLLVEAAQLQSKNGRPKVALQWLQEALDLQPDDTEFHVRTSLLCLYMDRAMAEEAASLLKGPLFTSIHDASASAESGDGGSAAETTARKAHEAKTAGCYSIALLSYISVHVLMEHKKPKAQKEAAQRLLERLRKAHAQNPFIAEFLAFAPAFEPTFPFGCELPEYEATAEEALLLEALSYCCQWGVRGQAPVWLDTDDNVRRFLRETLFEGDEDAAPLAPLPEPQPQEAQVLQRWRRAREEAMQLWAAEMSQDAGLTGAEEALEEELDFTDDDVLND
ncbi:unnamed protein product [Durusdinium trenchii]|uniref:Uncharacterized protein n=1 Tax=Durusdinium trenchii TaxID=1381693 RepID=A0ABP0P4X1_9DINO